MFTETFLTLSNLIDVIFSPPVSVSQRFSKYSSLCIKPHLSVLLPCLSSKSVPDLSVGPVLESTPDDNYFVVGETTRLPMKIYLSV